MNQKNQEYWFAAFLIQLACWQGNILSATLIVVKRLEAKLAA